MKDKRVSNQVMIRAIHVYIYFIFPTVSQNKFMKGKAIKTKENGSTISYSVLCVCVSVCVCKRDILSTPFHLVFTFQYHFIPFSPFSHNLVFIISLPPPFPPAFSSLLSNLTSFLPSPTFLPSLTCILLPSSSFIQTDFTRPTLCLFLLTVFCVCTILCVAFPSVCMCACMGVCLCVRRIEMVLNAVLESACMCVCLCVCV